MTAFFNRCRWLATTGGTGDFIVAGATAGFRTPAQASVPDTATVHYVATAENGDWEIGIGTYVSATTRIQRTIILENSLGTTAAINFGTPPIVMFDFLAQDIPIADLYDFGLTNVRREGTNELALRNGANAQTFTVYGSYTDATNWERIRFTGKSGDSFGDPTFAQFAAAFVAEKDGTGIARDIAFYKYGADGVNAETAQRVATIGRYSSFSSTPNNVPWQIHSNIYAALQIESKGTGAGSIEPERNLHLAAAGQGVWMTVTTTGNTTLPSNQAEVTANQGVFFFDMYASTLISGPTRPHWGGVCLIKVEMDGYVPGVVDQYPSKFRIATNPGIGGYNDRLIIPANGVTEITYSSGVTGSDNDVWECLRLNYRGWFDTALTGIGVEMTFATHNASPAYATVVGAGISAVSTDATNGSEDYDMVFKLMAAGATRAEVFRLLSDNSLRLWQDIRLHKDSGSPGRLAQRDGTSPQTLRIYNTYSSAGANYERFNIDWTTAAGAYCMVRNENSGTGTAKLMIPVTGATTVGALPAAGTVGAGARAFVTDATVTTFASTVAGGGSNKVPVVSDGTNWLIG